MKTKVRCEKFLVANGWEYDGPESGGSGYFIKSTFCEVEILDDEIVLLNGVEDFMHFPLNYYTLIGALMEHRQICVSYVSTPG